MLMTRARSTLGLLALALTASFTGPGLAQSALPDAAQIKAYAEGLLDEQKLGREGPGVALLVARGDQVLYKGARGVASIELGVPLQPDHVFRIGSVTKQFAAAALLKLIDEGKAGLEDPLKKYLPDYPKGERVTLRQLLNHTSGIKSYTGIPDYMDNPIRRELSTAALVAEFSKLPFDFAPGSSWRYNNSGYVLVGAVIEAITGKPWHQVVDEKLLAPQKLTRIAYPGETRVIPGMVTGYGFDGKQGVVGAGILSMTQPHAAGALVANTEDLWRWNLALHGGKLLSPASYQRMITPEGAAEKSRYGYGITTGTVRGQTVLQHGGGIHGFVSQLAYLPQSGVSVVILRNTTGPGFSMDHVSRKLAAFTMGKPYPENPVVELSLDQLKALEGVYALDEKQTRTLSVRGNQLFSQRSGGSAVALLAHGKDSFGMVGNVTRLQAQRDAAGKVAGLQIFQDGDGEAESWTRTGDLPAQVAITLTPEQQAALVGEYASPETELKVFKDEQGVLRLQVKNQRAFEMKARTPLNLYLTEVDVRLDFEMEQGRAVQLILNQGATRLVMKRR